MGGRDCDVALECSNSDEEKRHLSNCKALRQSESYKQMIFKAIFLLYVLVVLSAVVLKSWCRSEFAMFYSSCDPGKSV